VAQSATLEGIVEKMVEDENGRIDYDVDGAGPTIVLVPGSCSTGAAWRPVIAAWEGRFRCVTTSLLGYGGTAERRTATDTSIAHEVDILQSVILRAGGRVHLVGHSFGGLVAIALALSGRVPMASLTIVEAPAVELLQAAGEDQHYQAFRTMSDAYIAAFRNGEKHAIAAMVDFYGGAGTFASWPERVRNYATETTRVNVLDWFSAYGFPLSPAALAELDVPSLVLFGANSHPAARRANELLGRSISGASAANVAGAAHFMITTHAKEVARLIGQHVANVEGRR
jgi:pimeloyl-ACP methyl ester carboxylesterase